MFYNKKKIFLIGIVSIAAMISILIWLHMDKNKEEAFHDVKTKYNGEQEINEALKKLEKRGEKAYLIRDIDTVDRKVALTFEGLADPDIMKKILALLHKYNIKATFFVSGIESAEDQDSVLAIAKAEQEIGSYSLSARKHMEKLQEAEIVKDLCLTNVILRKIIGKEPQILKCNVTEYEDSFLTIVNACGINSVVESNYLLSYQSFSSYNMAEAYVKNLKKGTIISIKLKGTLNEEEYDDKQKDIDKEEDQKPAIDKQPTIKKEDKKTREEIDIVTLVEWVLIAMNDNNYSTEFVKDLSLYQDKDFDRDFDALRKSNDEKLAKVYKNVTTRSKLIAYLFRGIKNEAILNNILAFLKENQIKATFFVTGNEAVDYPRQVQKILDEGHTIGNGGLTGDELIGKDFGQVYFDIWKGQKVLQERFGVTADIFMPVYGNYDDTIREVVQTLGCSAVTYNKRPIKEKEASVDQIMNSYKGFAPGDVIFFRLGYHDKLDQIVTKTYEEIKKAGYSVVDIQTLLKNESTTRESTSTYKQNNEETEGNIQQPLLSDYEQLKIKNNGNKAKVITNLYTTQPAVAYIFRGISDRAALDSVLEVLDDIDAQASFFVTGKEIMNYPDNVQEIVNRGHEIYNGGYGMNPDNPSHLDFNSICYEIEMGKRCLKNFLGEAYSEEDNAYYMPLYADINGNVLEAASALGYNKVVTYNKSTMIKAYKDLSVDEIIADYFANTIALHRGDIVYYRLDYLTQPGAIKDLIRKIANVYIKQSTYNIVSLNNMINSDLVYQPVSRLEGVGSDLIKPTYHYSEDELLNSIFDRYIGNQSIDSSEELIGFTDDEIAQIDKIGEVDTKEEKVIFLTFDDWGSDKAVTNLLNLLDKYDVKASFFVRVGNDSVSIKDNMGNPNLLRAIALNGHDIGNHTFTHMKINILTEDERNLLREDIVAAHQEMARYIGDTGALKLFFRPPTLAVSKLGVETIFDCGYKYIINGDFSTHDYEAQSSEELINKLINGMGKRSIEDGSIVVMHMSDNSRYTAEALDVVIPYYQAKGYRFAKLSDYLN
ncbi:polysaccharide deacetylase family protein [Vallitalea maricola]|uniref:Uncharacterized protein n=1 Tax=Vallitalea maricola TaxID=3074433 RepID=A0ACB5UGA8_9FIRM|nr:hypothetical protein AN2V17_12070 [Vallitalea sp. AN17-2]